MKAAEPVALALSEIRPPFYPCPVSEQETIVQMSRDGETASVYTNDLTTLTKLRRAANAKGSLWRLTKIDYSRGCQCGWRFECPKRLISFRSKSLAKADGSPRPDEAQGLALDEQR